MPQASDPQSLQLVRSTLEMAGLMRRLYPALSDSIREIEAEVRRGGEMLLEAATIPLARTALQTIHAARLKLQELDSNANRLAA